MMWTTRPYTRARYYPQPDDTVTQLCQLTRLGTAVTDGVAANRPLSNAKDG